MLLIEANCGLVELAAGLFTPFRGREIAALYFKTLFSDSEVCRVEGALKRLAVLRDPEPVGVAALPDVFRRGKSILCPFHHASNAPGSIR